MVVITFGALWLLNHLTDFTSDDWSYHFFYESRTVSGTPRRLGGPLEVFSSIASHYHVQNGRSLAHALLQWCTLLGKPWFDVLNALVFVAVGHLVLQHVRPGRHRVLSAVAVYAAMFVFIPFFGQSVLWMAGGVNYLWMSAVSLLALLPWRLHRPTVRSAWWMIPLGALAGLAGGSTNENSAGAWILMALAFMASWARQGRRPPLWSWLGVGAALVGLGVQLASPGNHVRAQRLGGVAVEGMVRRLPELWRVGLESAGWVLAAFVIVLVIRLMAVRRVDAAAGWALVWAGAGLLSGVAMIVSPFVPHRSWIWTVLFLMVGIGLLVQGVPEPRGQRLLRTATVPLVVLAAVVYGAAYASIAQTHREVAHSLEQVDQAKRAGQRNVTVTKFRLTDNRWNALAWTPNLTANPDGTVNRWFAVYHGIDSVTVDNPDQVRR